jgi:hypothetical protein
MVSLKKAGFGLLPKMSSFVFLIIEASLLPPKKFHKI